MPFCPNCGNETQQSHQFCGTCGATLQEAGFTDGRPEAVYGDMTLGQAREPFNVLQHLQPTGRAGRKDFILTVLAIWAATAGTLFVLGFVLGFFYTMANPGAPLEALEKWVAFIEIPTFIIALLLTIFQFTKRLHDFGRPGWHRLFFLIPLWSWVETFKMVFIKGNEFPNQYG